jgi:hypothetical protein
MGIVGLGHVQRDQSLVMPGHDLLRPALHGGRIVEEVERQALGGGGLFRLGFQRQAQADQGVEQAPLGFFHFAPQGRHRRIGQIGNRAVVAAGTAHPARRIARSQPVADAKVIVVGADHQIGRIVVAILPRGALVGQMAKTVDRWIITQRGSAIGADPHFKMAEAQAVGAGERAHGWLRWSRGMDGRKREPRRLASPLRRTARCGSAKIHPAPDARDRLRSRAPLGKRPPR